MGNRYSDDQIKKQIEETEKYISQLGIKSLNINEINTYKQALKERLKRLKVYINVYRGLLLTSGVVIGLNISNVEKIALASPTTSNIEELALLTGALLVLGGFMGSESINQLIGYKAETKKIEENLDLIDDTIISRIR